MRVLLSIVTLAFPLLAPAGVYKWIGPDGRIQYSDRPVTGAEPVAISAGSSSEPVKSRPVPASDTNDSSGDLGPYDSLEIVRPEPNQTLRDAEGKVEIGLLIEPPLSEEHRLEILVNGQPVPGDSRETQIVLQGLSFGSHRAQVRVQDDLDEVVASSEVVNFHMRKPLPEDSQP